ncbi:2-dehydro-3-deoxygalactonokinase [Phaeovulum sp.]|uniref:2-dehydro-3-deoxygalactonokinase n=1 Tax=Phaeovulum sp. TaxID=2934796 RepID=UPI00272F5DD6|nr:2-dehydro-3-deoxygalactonokinase [Phaeovulum sp.]MDP1670024.1 2-dehydro-3-deoxygalactonokinase [Phaeovulum sp.]MDZ4119307.1 2-dehydro-3-deoxygalactonokinase [Phaeovulum sp.]
MTAVDWIGAELTPEALHLWVAVAGRVPVRRAVPLSPGDAPEVALASARLQLSNSAVRPVLCCGFPGAPTRPLPCPPLAADRPIADVAGNLLLPDLVQPAPRLVLPAAHALRLAGCLAADPGFDGVICLPGPLSYWVETSAGEVISATAAFSGALAEALTASRWFAPQPPAADAIDLAAFDADLPQTMSRPERMLRMLAEARALPPPAVRARLYAALIGADLAAARPWWLGRRLRVLGENAALYARALAAQGVPVTVGDAEAALIAGFALAARVVTK